MDFLNSWQVVQVRGARPLQLREDYRASTPDVMQDVTTWLMISDSTEGDIQVKRCHLGLVAIHQLNDVAKGSEVNTAHFHPHLFACATLAGVPPVE